MRLLYVLCALFLWLLIMTSGSDLTCASADTKFLALAIMIAGAMAGGDGK